ncbi:MAG: ABC-2 family transporter protein [Eubacteriales bacterium]|nr:ABC-2 family transporter protein [Eubacteriales bacterium]
MKNKLPGLKIYRSLLGMSFRSMLQYRADFISGLLGVILLNGANIAEIGVLSWKFKSIASWTAGELMILYGLYMVCWSICSVFFSHTAELENEIADGTFDKYLCRPLGAFVQFIGGEFNYVGLCDTFLGVVLILTGKKMCGILWSPGKFCLLLLFILCGGTIIVCIRLLLACSAFRVTRSGPLFSMLMLLSMLTQKYPIGIFGNTFRILVTAVLPLAYVNYYPAVYLLEKSDAPAWLCLLSPVVALLLVLLTAAAWKKGMDRYESAGG